MRVSVKRIRGSAKREYALVVFPPAYQAIRNMPRFQVRQMGKAAVFKINFLRRQFLYDLIILFHSLRVKYGCCRILPQHKGVIC